MIALDTNLLLYALNSGAPQHAGARAAVEKAAASPAGWGIPAACALEFWSVATRQTRGPAIATTAEAAAFLAALHRAGAQFWQAGSEFVPRLLALARQRDVRGRRIFDLSIALVALDNGATELWSHDREFHFLPGLRLRDPLRPA